MIKVNLIESIKQKITRVKQDPDIKGSGGTEPAKYYAKGAEGGKDMSKSTKQDREDILKRVLQ